MNTTKTTTASVRVMLSHNYSNFEIAIQLENPDGISFEEIQNARQNCQHLATCAVDEYKTQPNMNPKQEIVRVEKKLEEIKNFVHRNAETHVDPEEIEKVKNMPTYTPPEKIKSTPAKK